MWRKVQFMTGALCVLLYAGVAAWAGVAVFQARQQQKERAGREFAGLAALAEAAGAGADGFPSRRLRDDVEYALRSSLTLQAAILAGPDGRFVVAEKSPGAVRWRNERPRFSANPLLFTKPFFSAPRPGGVSLGAVAAPVDYATLLGILRTALFAVLVSAGVSFSVLMLGFLPALNRKAYGETDDGESAGEASQADGGESAGEPPQTDGDESAGEPPQTDDGESAGEPPRAGDGESAGEPRRAGDGRAACDADAAGLRDGARGAAIKEAGASAAPEPPDVAAADAFEKALFAGEDADEPPDVRPEEAAPPDAPDASFLEEPPEFDELDRAFKESFPPEDPLAALPEGALDGLPVGAARSDPAEEPAAASDGDGPPPQAGPGPALPFYEGFGDELSAAYPEARAGLLAAASRLCERDILACERESDAFMEALSAALESVEAEHADLCLLAACWTEGEAGDESLAAAARDFFKPEDRIFGRFGGGVYVVIPDRTLDGAFALAKEFHARASGGLSEDDLLVIGLSARAGRRVDAARLLKETRRALEKAREDDGLPIAAFKADAEKYARLYAAGL